MITTNASDSTATLSHVLIPAPIRFRNANLTVVMAASHPSCRELRLYDLVFHHSPIIQDDLPAKDANDFFVVSGKQKRGLKIPAEAGHRIEDVVGVLRVQVRRRFI